MSKQRENIDLINGIIKITATLQRIPAINGESGKKTKIIITEPKLPRRNGLYRCRAF